MADAAPPIPSTKLRAVASSPCATVALSSATLIQAVTWSVEESMTTESSRPFSGMEMPKPLFACLGILTYIEGKPRDSRHKKKKKTSPTANTRKRCLCMWLSSREGATMAARRSASSRTLSNCSVRCRRKQKHQKQNLFTESDSVRNLKLSSMTLKVIQSISLNCE